MDEIEVPAKEGARMGQMEASAAGEEEHTDENEALGVGVAVAEALGVGVGVAVVEADDVRTDGCREEEEGATEAYT